MQSGVLSSWTSGIQRRWLVGIAWIAWIALACRSTNVTPQEVVFGEWRVSGSRCPTSCAVSPGEAARWHGQVARYSATRAQFGDYACEKPRYLVDYWPASGIYGGVRLADLGITAGSVKVVDVQCSSSPLPGSDPWLQTPGAFLVVVDQANLFMVWKGTYFEVRRQ